MRLVASYGAGAIALLRRDAVIYLSYRMRLVSQIFSLLFSLTLFYYVSRLVTIESFGTPDDYYAFVVVGMIILQVVTATLGTLPMGVRQELVAGTFERLVLSPFGGVAGIVSSALFPLAMSTVMAVVMLILAATIFGLPLQGSAPLALPIAYLGALAFAPFAFFITAVIVAFKQAPGANFVLAGISIVAGLYFPVTLLPGWIEWMSDVQPFTPAVDLMRNLLVGTPLGDPAWTLVARLTGFAVVLLPLSTWLLSFALGVAQRRGTIIEY